MTGRHQGIGTAPGSLEQQILEAIREGHTSREALMAIESLRHRTWAVVAVCLGDLTKRRVLIANKAGWRLV